MPGPTSRKSRYNLFELMQQCDTNAPLSAEDRDWQDAPASKRARATS